MKAINTPSGLDKASAINCAVGKLLQCNILYQIRPLLVLARGKLAGLSLLKKNFYLDVDRSPINQARVSPKSNNKTDGHYNQFKIIKLLFIITIFLTIMA